MSGEAGGSKLGNVLKAKEDMQKSPEQLEKEKREIIASRVVKINLDRKTKDDLVEEAKNFHNILITLHSQIYELNEKHERQKYDMMELTNRAIQIERGKAKTRKSNIVHTGLGGSVLPFIAETYTQAPGKISLFSRYERVTDRRTFKDRRDVWAITKEKKVKEVEVPKAKIKNIDSDESNNYNRKPRNKPTAAEEAHHEEEKHEEEEPQHHEEEEEQHHEEEAAHEEEPAAEEE